MTVVEAENYARIIANTPTVELEAEIEFIYNSKLDYEESDLVAMMETELAVRSGYTAV